MSELSGITIRDLIESDWAVVQSIYHHGIVTRQATFETAVPPWSAWNRKHLIHSRLVACMSNNVVGWSALSPVSERCVYQGVAEVSVYVAPDRRGAGIGTGLLQELIRSAELNGIWTLQAGIFPENRISIHLFKKCGFREVGIRENLGVLDGVWRDVILMERRSAVTGV